MESLQNKIVIDAKDNPALRDLVATWKTGEKVTFTIEAQVDDIVGGGDSATLSLESIEPKGYENPNPEDGEDSDEIKASKSSPIMLALGAKMGADA